MRLSLLKSAQLATHGAPVVVWLSVIRFQPQRLLKMALRRRIVLLFAADVAEIIVQVRTVRLQPKSGLVLFAGLLPIAFFSQNIGQAPLRLGVPGIESN